MTGWDDPEGAVLDDRYEVGPRLGRGGSGVVHRAWDRTRRRSVAVKLLAPGSALEAPKPGRSEADVLAALDHPNLVALHDVLTTEHGPVLVMELVDGPSLHDRLAGGPLPLEDAATVLRDIAAGLSHAHRRGIVHRDVKPGNVLLVRAGEGVAEARLADFGIARRADATRTTAERTVVGTVRFVSPEQLRGDRVADASDVYSLGLTVLTAITGEDPFPGGDAASLAARLVRPPSLPAALPGVWADLLREMTALDPADRPDASAVAARACLLGEAPALVATPSPAAPRPAAAVPGLPEPAVGPARRRRAARVGALGGAVAVLGAAIGAVLAIASGPAPGAQLLGEGPGGRPLAVTAAPTAAGATREAAGPSGGTEEVVPGATSARTPADDHGGSEDRGSDDPGGRGSGGHGSDDSGGRGSGGHGSDD